MLEVELVNHYNNHKNIAKYINDNKLTECNINVVEVPNDYKKCLGRTNGQTIWI